MVKCRNGVGYSVDHHKMDEDCRLKLTSDTWFSRPVELPLEEIFP